MVYFVSIIKFVVRGYYVSKYFLELLSMLVPIFALVMGFVNVSNFYRIKYLFDQDISTALTYDVAGQNILFLFIDLVLYLVIFVILHKARKKKKMIYQLNIQKIKLNYYDVKRSTENFEVGEPLSQISYDHEKAVEFQDINFTDEEGNQLFKNLNFSAEKGQVTLLVCKDSSLRLLFEEILIGFQLQDSGNVWIFKGLIAKQKKQILRGVGLVSEFLLFDFELRASDIVNFY